MLYSHVTSKQYLGCDHKFNSANTRSDLDLHCRQILFHEISNLINAILYYRKKLIGWLLHHATSMIRCIEKLKSKMKQLISSEPNYSRYILTFCTLCYVLITNNIFRTLKKPRENSKSQITSI